ncbi:hypothetical protein OB960_25390 [Halobacteria archaeon AArc-xg1-1]|uniref:Uncharacterized protein n=1 Tax=Natronoglomus mannanivorans TaxID=2979990 RepID=A0AAP2Z4H1_9EURY|nr:hypothetical protein [Halobacteria archaeon AArc-xg1-1]
MRDRSSSGERRGDRRWTLERIDPFVGAGVDELVLISTGDYVTTTQSSKRLPDDAGSDRERASILKNRWR